MLAVILMFGVPTANTKSTNTVIVIYPDLPPPHREIFNSIIEGIREKSKAPIVLRPLQRDHSGLDPIEGIDDATVSGMIVLGRRGMEAAESIKWKVPRIVGAVIWDGVERKYDYSGISLDPSPRVLFRKLVQLDTRIRKIHVISDTSRSGWIIGQSHKHAAEHGITIIVHKVTTQAEAIKEYVTVLERLNPSSEALWLPLDSTTVDDVSILPMVLRAAWERNIIVFSSSPDHVQRGVLFSAQPDYRRLGAELQKQLQTMMSATRSERESVTPMETIFTTVNIRMAQHLGLRVIPHLFESEVR